MASKKAEMETEIVIDEDMTEEEIQEEIMEDMAANEEDYLHGLLEAADLVDEDTQKIEIVRHKKVLFAFSIRALTDEETNQIRKLYTTYEKNKRTGVKIATEVNNAKHRSSLIYNATIEEDRKKLWDNRAVWNGLKRKGKTIVNALDVIDAVLLPGEKEMVIEAINKVCGYDEEEKKVETAKNL